MKETEPLVSPMARPLGEMAATLGAELDQVAKGVRFCMLPSEKVPVSVNWRSLPGAKLAPLGLMAMEVRVAGVTTTAELLEKEPIWAWTLERPGAMPVTVPVELVAVLLVALLVKWELSRALAVASEPRAAWTLTVATPLLPLDQVTWPADVLRTAVGVGADGGQVGRGGFERCGCWWAAR